MRLHDPNLDQTTYLPGEKGTLEIAFAPKGNGRQTKTLTVRCNDPERPVTILKISSTIKPFVKPDPLYLRYEEVSKGESKQLTLDLQCVDPNFEILTSASVGPPPAISKWSKIRSGPIS